MTPQNYHPYMKNTPHPPSNFIRIDYTIQWIIICLIIISLLVWPLAIFLLMPFGAWQVASAIVGVFYRSPWRKKYLLMVFVYFCSYSVAALMGDSFWDNDILMWIFMPLYLLIPLVLGVYYLQMTHKEYRLYRHQAPQGWDGKDTGNMNDILDVDMMR